MEDPISPEEMEVPDEIEFEIEEPLSELKELRPLRTVAAVGLESEATTEGHLLIPDPVDFIDVAAVNRSVASITNHAGPTAKVVSMDDEQLAEQLFDDRPLEVADRIADRLEVTQLFQSEGDEQQSLLTVVEALDANSEPVDLDGKISLMVMTADEETPRRLKRWNFTSAETVAAWQSSDLGDGLHLELPLEKLRLPASPLELWVRVVMDDGRKLLTQLPFELNQLSNIDTEENSTELASTPIAAQPVPSPKESRSTAPSNKPSLVEQESPLNQPRWRASMQRTDRAAGSFAVTSRKNQGWTTQAIGREPQTPVRHGGRRLATGPRRVAAELPAQPLWNSSPGMAPTTPTPGQQPNRNAPATWSSAR